MGGNNICVILNLDEKSPHKNTVSLFPVGIPDQGIFDYVDQFLEENPKYLELSDRKMLAWAASSGVRGRSSWPVSNDKPGMNLGIQALDDGSAQKTITALLPALNKDVLCLELDGN